MLSKWSWLLPIILCGAAGAQSTTGYLFVAPGGWTQGVVSARISTIPPVGATHSVYGVGGGAERLLGRGAGAGVELGGVVPREADAVGIFSLNGYYHFLRQRRLDPFATAGYSLIFRTFTANAFNYGGGVRYWFPGDLGLLVEVRDHVWGRRAAPAAHVWGVRVGLTFR